MMRDRSVRRRTAPTFAAGAAGRLRRCRAAAGHAADRGREPTIAAVAMRISFVDIDVSFDRVDW